MIYAEAGVSRSRRSWREIIATDSSAMVTAVFRGIQNARMRRTSLIDAFRLTVDFRGLQCTSPVTCCLRETVLSDPMKVEKVLLQCPMTKRASIKEEDATGMVV